MSPIAIFWFRRDLRLQDNTGLYAALTSGLPVLPLFIFDSNILESLPDRDDRRIAFIYQQLHHLQQALTEQGSSLLVRHGRPEAVFKALLQEFQIAGVYANGDYEPYARKRDKAVFDLLQAGGVTLKLFKDQVIFHKNDLLTAQGSPYTVYTPYKNKWLDLFSQQQVQPHPSEKAGDGWLRIKPLKIPSLADLGFSAATGAFPQPEVDETIIRQYHEQRDYPGIQAGTTRLSVQLRFGTSSIRTLVAKALDWNQTWLQELIWREFFMTILWHFPRVVETPFKEKYGAIQWRNNQQDFNAWCEGKTGYPIVDAGMRELNATGFMHNRVRMITASFLVKHLLIDWRKGEAYFARKLLDFDLSANNGNWQWAAGCGCDAAPYFRIFNPHTQTKKFDPDRVYIRRWVPEVDTPDYPAPIVEHRFARERVLAAYKDALS